MSINQAETMIEELEFSLKQWRQRSHTDTEVRGLPCSYSHPDSIRQDTEQAPRYTHWVGTVHPKTIWHWAVRFPIWNSIRDTEKGKNHLSSKVTTTAKQSVLAMYTCRQGFQWTDRKTMFSYGGMVVSAHTGLSGAFASSCPWLLDVGICLE